MLPCVPSLLPAEPDWAAFAAIDWASRKHFWSLAPVGGPPESGTLDNTPEAVELWAIALHRRFAAHPIAISIVVLYQERDFVAVNLARLDRMLFTLMWAHCSGNLRAGLLQD